LTARRNRIAPPRPDPYAAVMHEPPRSLRSLPLQGALAASGQPFARLEQSPGLFQSGLSPEGARQRLRAAGRR